MPRKPKVERYQATEETTEIHVDEEGKRKAKARVTEKAKPRTWNLSPEEVASINDCIQAISVTERQLRVMRAGLQAYWQQVVKDNEMPNQFDYDYATGVATEKFDG